MVVIGGGGRRDRILEDYSIPRWGRRKLFRRHILDDVPENNNSNRIQSTPPPPPPVATAAAAASAEAPPSIHPAAAVLAPLPPPPPPVMNGRRRPYHKEDDNADGAGDHRPSNKKIKIKIRGPSRDNYVGGANPTSSKSGDTTTTRVLHDHSLLADEKEEKEEETKTCSVAPVEGGGNININNKHWNLRSMNKSSSPSSTVDDNKRRPKFSLTLSRKDIKEDLVKLFGAPPAKVPKTRPAKVQRELDEREVKDMDDDNTRMKSTGVSESDESNLL